MSFTGGAWFVSRNSEVLWELEVSARNLPVAVAVVAVSWAVVLYSGWYIASDPSSPYFLSLVQGFVFFMICLLLAGSTPVLFLGWEGIGILSFLLISYWQTRTAAVQASMQGFVLNRVGDMALALAVVCVLSSQGAVDLSLLAGTEYRGHSLTHWLLLGAAAGKSAQLGLHAWLPSAIEAPTPVSALIHAATLVTAGVYLLMRFIPGQLYTQGGATAIFLGASTLLMAGFVGLAQSDLKRTIAFSTCSQVAYMVLGMGGISPGASAFLLLTHAFYKALLFIAAGVVIHASGNNQDVRLIGASGLTLPVSKELFASGSFALCALPFSAGDFSKDLLLEQLGYAYLTLHQGFWICGLLGTVLTGAYSARLLRLTFASEPRGGSLLPQHESRGFVLVGLTLLGCVSYSAGIGCAEVFVPTFWESAFTLNVEQVLTPVSSLLPLVSMVLGFGLGLLLPGIPNSKLRSVSYHQAHWELASTRITLAGFLAATRVSTKGIDGGVWEVLGPHGLATALWSPLAGLSASSTQSTSYPLGIALVLLALLACG
jgi:NADH:ubiquinone oxidoreductase subunit 5 (subunit L)/multisubunit Na+/H+ antiporter MnhA subunit